VTLALILSATNNTQYLPHTQRNNSYVIPHHAAWEMRWWIKEEHFEDMYMTFVADNETSEARPIILSVNHDSCLFIVALDHCQENAVSVLKVSVIYPFNRDICQDNFRGLMS
jgi:hypothetical protein